MNIIKWYKVCRKNGHHMVFDRPTLGGEYIKCKECSTIDEYLPGLHEPKGYVENKVGKAYKKAMDKVLKDQLNSIKKPKANPTPRHWN